MQRLCSLCVTQWSSEFLLQACCIQTDSNPHQRYTGTAQPHNLVCTHWGRGKGPGISILIHHTLGLDSNLAGSDLLQNPVLCLQADKTRMLCCSHPARMRWRSGWSLSSPLSGSISVQRPNTPSVKGRRNRGADFTQSGLQHPCSSSCTPMPSKSASGADRCHTDNHQIKG